MNNPMVKTITIIGGGTAGWMTAATLSRFLENGFQIHLIESDEIGTVGVGEATIPQIRVLNQALGLDEADFVRSTQGTFKLGIEFTDWLRPGHRYIHAFGDIGRPLGLIEFHHYWLRAQAEGSNTGLDAYSLSAVAAHSNKFANAVPSQQGAVPVTYAYHFDAGLYAAYLRKYAEGNNVKRHEGRIVSTQLNSENGHVASVTLENGAVISGDIFIDCSGFRGLLIEEALHTGYDDWTQYLPCDRALAVPCSNAATLTPYTRSTARKAGWQWRIPLQHRVGNGHVYCSRFISDDEATATLLDNLDGEPLAEPRPITFTTGRRRKFWNKNVVAMGLASGFMEPLESTSIHMIQTAVERFLKFLPLGDINEADVDAYNAQTAFEYESIRDFLILHYHANQREEAFWAGCRDMPIPQSLQDKLTLFQANGRLLRKTDELFTEHGWLQVMAGQGIKPQGYHPLAHQISGEDLKGFLGSMQILIEKQVGAMPMHAEFIAQNCASGPN
jgi:tryptophan 7-halogenase